MLRAILAALAAVSLTWSLGAAEDDSYYGDDFFDPVGLQPDEPATPEEAGPPILGIQMTPPPKRVQEREGLAPDQGVYVFRVYPDTAAEALGLQAGDVITSVNGRPITSMTDLREAVAGTAVGEEAIVQTSRNAQLETHSGAVFREWPESIPWQRIDAEAERRYRDRQKSRLARDIDQLAAADQEALALRQDLDAGAAKLAGLDRAGERAAAATAATGAGPQLPLALLALAAWNFDYAIAVGDDQPPVQLVTVPVSPLAAVAPAFDLDLSMTASSEAL